MAYGVKALRKIQLGVETTAGTEVNATAVWRGEGTIINDSPVEFVPEDIGYLQDQGRTYIPKVGALIELDETPATFEQLPYLLQMGVDGAATGSADGVGSGYIYAYTLATNAVRAPDTYTVEGGDNSEEYQSTYFFCEEFKLKGAANEAVMMSGKLRGKQVATGSEFTASLTAATVEEVLFNKGKIYIDTTTIGTTVKTGTWLAFELNVPTGFQAVWSGDGNLYFSAVKQSDLRDITGSITLENDATGVAEVAAAVAETTRLVRLIFEGSALTTSGTAYTYRTLKIDLAIKYTEVPSLDEQDGDNTVKLPFKVIYNAAGGVITVVNQLSALT